MEIDYMEFIMAHKVPFMIVYGFLFLMSFFGNLLIIIVMCKNKALKETSANCFIVAIAAADWISGTFVIPLSIYGVSYSPSKSLELVLNLILNSN